MKICALVPYYNHPATIAEVARRITAQGLFCIIVDDGSNAESKAVLERLKNRENLFIFHRTSNGGKGAAVKTGFTEARRLGFSHVLQVDADAQHNLEDIPRFIALAQQFPEDLICGKPVYGADVPKSRLYGRKITNFWIAVHTFSLQIPDGMCGFRLYPLAAVERLDPNQIGDFMDFDVEILVRLHWLGVRSHWLDTAVKYGEQGVSHFRVWKDNLLISLMHSRLFFNMLALRAKQLCTAFGRKSV